MIAIQDAIHIGHSCILCQPELSKRNLIRYNSAGTSPLAATPHNVNRYGVCNRIRQKLV